MTILSYIKCTKEKSILNVKITNPIMADALSNGKDKISLVNHWVYST